MSEEIVQEPVTTVVETSPPPTGGRRVLVPLTAPQMIAIYRNRYPEALVCTVCGRLLATERERYARLTDAQAQAFVCAECRWEAAEAERVRASKSARGRKGAETRTARRLGGVTHGHAEAEPGREYVPEIGAHLGSKETNGFLSSKSDGAGEDPPPLAHLRRTGGWKPGTSRQARYRRRHPERTAADLRRLRKAP